MESSNLPEYFRSYLEEKFANLERFLKAITENQKEENTALHLRINTLQDKYDSRLQKLEYFRYWLLGIGAVIGVIVGLIPTIINWALK